MTSNTIIVLLCHVRIVGILVDEVYDLYFSKQFIVFSLSLHDFVYFVMIVLEFFATFESYLYDCRFSDE